MRIPRIAAGRILALCCVMICSVFADGGIDVAAARSLQGSAARPLPTSRHLRLRRAMRPRRRLEQTQPLRPLSRGRSAATRTMPRRVVVSPRQAILELTNAERAQQGLPALTYNERLERAAQAHAEDMAAHSYFSHVNPEGQQYHDRILEAGYGNLSIETCNCKTYWVSFGENLAEGYSDPAEVVRDWMNSPPHRKNILASEFNEIGVGIAGDIWVQNFGRIELEPLE